jgi:hypothetical protein
VSIKIRTVLILTSAIRAKKIKQRDPNNKVNPFLLDAPDFKITEKPQSELPKLSPPTLSEVKNNINGGKIPFPSPV